MGKSYFSHDSNALADIKISAMRCDYGLEGYGLYWAIIEMLRNEETYKLPLSKNMYRKIKIDTGTTIDVEQYINDCISEYKEVDDGNGLFNTNGKYFWSESLLRRMTKMEEVSTKRRQAGQKGAAGRWKKTEDEDLKNNEKTLKNGKCIANAITYYGKCYKNYGKPMANYSKYKYKYKYKDKDKDRYNLSIYPNPSFQKNDNEMDKIGQAEFNEILQQCQISLYDEGLKEELTNVLKELYLDKNTRQKIRNLNVKHIDKALKNFAIANTREDIKRPKEYFKKCLLSVLQDMNLANQYDIDTIYENLGDGG